MKTLAIIFWGVLAMAAEAREQWRVERYAEIERLAACDLTPRKADRSNSWRPQITPGWPLSTGRWIIRWEGTF